MPQPDQPLKTTTNTDGETRAASEGATVALQTADGMAALQQFKQLWRDGTIPDVTEYVAAAGPLSDELLAAILRADLHYRWAQGKSLPVEWYLQRFEQLAVIPDLAVDLIYTEYLQAEKYGNPHGEEEFLLRFPQHRETLRDQFVRAFCSGFIFSPARNLSQAVCLA